MTLSKILWDLHHSSDVGNAVEGLAELAEALERDLPIHKANTDKLAELVLYCVQRKIGRANQEAHEAMMIHCDALTAQLALVKAAYGNLAGAINNLDETDTNKEEMWGQVFSVMQDGWNSFSRDMANYYQGQLYSINEYCIKNGFEFVQHNPALTMIHEMEKLRSERDALSSKIHTAARVEKLLEDAPDLTFNDCLSLFPDDIRKIRAKAVKDFVKSLPSYAHDYDVDERLEKQAIQYEAKILNGEIK